MKSLVVAAVGLAMVDAHLRSETYSYMPFLFKKRHTEHIIRWKYCLIPSSLKISKRKKITIQTSFKNALKGICKQFLPV